MVSIKPVAFNVDVVGEVTGENYVGTFKAVAILTHNQQLERDRLRREFLGTGPEAAWARAQNQAALLSEIAVRLTDAPAWWRESQNGLALYDDAPVAAVYEEVMKLENEFKAEILKKGEAAKASLKKTEIVKSE